MFIVFEFSKSIFKKNFHPQIITWLSHNHSLSRFVALSKNYQS